MDPSTTLLFNTTVDVLRQKDCRIAEQDALLKHQQKLIAEQHAEKAILQRKVEELQSHAATVQGRLYDVVAELAALKCKPVEHMETQTEPVKVQETQVQTKEVQTTELAVQEMQVQTKEVQTTELAVQEMQVQTDMPSLSQEAGIDQYPLVFWKPKQEPVLVQFAQASVRRFWTEVLAACTVVASELVEISMENAVLQADAELDTVKERIRQAKAGLKTPEAQAGVESPETQQVKKAAKKKRAAKPTAEEKAARAEAELKAHQEAVRARQEEERRQKAQAIADRKAKMQALRASAREQERTETQKPVGKAKAGRPDTSALSTAQIDRANEFARITKETFLTRGHVEFEGMAEGTIALLGLYVLECFGSESWKLKQVDQQFMLVVDRVYGAKKTPVYYQSPLVSAQDIVLWVERADFVKGSEYLFKHVPVPEDDRVAATIVNAFELIRENWAFGVLKLRKADILDDYGLAMQHITLKDQSVMTMTILKLIIWFRQGRIKALATCVNVQAAIAMLDDDLYRDD